MADLKRRTVLITGCSDGGMGAALVREFHSAGLHVYATARNPAKMASLGTLGPDVELKTLDISSAESIKACLADIPHLDILVNNAGASYVMTVADMSLEEGKALFDLNVWGNVALSQAALPLLLKSSKGMIVNHTSTAAHAAIPYHAAYAASKAAMSMFTTIMREELEVSFGIKVIELKTGAVNTEIVKNARAKEGGLPETSIYAAAKEVIDPALRGEFLQNGGITAEAWAKGVVGDLLSSSPPNVIWRGKGASQVRLASWFPMSWLSGPLKKLTGLDKVEKIVRKP
ncbi:hypothetical protein LTR95_010169 [Oleoguttula sp. CCFEE 5521]